MCIHRLTVCCLFRAKKKQRYYFQYWSFLLPNFLLPPLSGFFFYVTSEHDEAESA